VYLSEATINTTLLDDIDKALREIVENLFMKNINRDNHINRITLVHYSFRH